MRVVTDSCFRRFEEPALDEDGADRFLRGFSGESESPARAKSSSLMSSCSSDEDAAMIEMWFSSDKCLVTRPAVAVARFTKRQQTKMGFRHAAVLSAVSFSLGILFPLPRF